MPQPQSGRWGCPRIGPKNKSRHDVTRNGDNMTNSNVTSANATNAKVMEKNKWNAAVEAAELPPLGQWPSCSQEQEDNARRAEARGRTARARAALVAAQAELAAASAAELVYVVADVDECPGGAHTHGGWCRRASARLVPWGAVPQGTPTYLDLLTAVRVAAAKNRQRAIDWQCYLNA